MKVLCVVLLLMCPTVLLAQSRTVLPEELALHLEVEATDHVPMVGEMVLITVKGTYRRHITREEIIQPDFEGFNWTQLGADTWRDARLNGEKVKTFSRRMAVYPNRPGRMTIGAFTHKLTLTDERDDWFEHRIASAPVTIDVLPAPVSDSWWFPVAALKVSDQWSNAPDQLQPGEGVLRVMRVEALGVTPEMIPPMPELKSPSAMIFPHPEKRFAELSPAGPVSYAFWRWTIRPSNDTSTIVEPLSFDYFDTRLRTHRKVTISAQRVAYGTVVPDAEATDLSQFRETPTALPGWPLGLLALVTLALGFWISVPGRRFSVSKGLRRWPLLDPLAWQMRRAARRRNLTGMRRAASDILRRDGPSSARKSLITELDRAIFDSRDVPIEMQEITWRFLRAADA